MCASSWKSTKVILRCTVNQSSRYCSAPTVLIIRGVAIKKPDSCSNPLLKKIRQSKCYPLQCSPLPDPYTAPCEFSTV